MRTTISAIALFAALLAPALAETASDRLLIDVDKPGVAISPLLYGIFFEEINRAGDGGIYAEMVQNRSFEDAGFPIAWRVVDATIALDRSEPLNEKNPTSLRVDAKSGGGVMNGGFVGGLQRGNLQEWQGRIVGDPGEIAVEKDKPYELSLYARAEQPVTLTVALREADGKVLASQKIRGVGAKWQKFEVTLSPNETDSNAGLVIASDDAATFWLDMVSMFPRDTWKGRKNGLRADLMETIATMKPAFVRFPGGCYVEGDEIENRFRWKDTIGDIAPRPGHWNLWGYRSTDGLGYHEYLQMCEDLGAEPLFVINCGMSHHQGRANAYAVPMEEMGPYVQDALDAIEYANGPVTSEWGALRAKNGHPEPFHMKMIQIGNENGGPDYNERYALFFDAIKARYRDMKLVACDWSGLPRSRPLDIVDPHHYGDFASFLNQTTRYDAYDRSGPVVYFGEYAVTVDAGTGSLRAALAEAAFMTGLERNSDIVRMSSYAPLLSHKDWKGWNPNAIVFDQSHIYGTPSYWVQAMFAGNRGDVILPLELDMAATAAPPIAGRIGVGTWRTQAEFKDIKVEKDGKTLFESDFSQDAEDWQRGRGTWVTEDGVLRQTSDEEGAIALIGDEDWRDYTLSLKARKLSGAEGFLISFGARSPRTRSWWNIGGWVNTEHAVESDGMNSPRVRGTIESGRWYDIKIELQGAAAKFYLDGKLVHNLARTLSPAFAAVAGRDAETGETILKFVNTSNKPRTVRLELRGEEHRTIAGRALVLTSADDRDENSFDAPTCIAPREESFTAEAPDFTHTFPASSVSVLRWK